MSSIWSIRVLFICILARNISFSCILLICKRRYILHLFWLIYIYKLLLSILRRLHFNIVSIVRIHWIHLHLIHLHLIHWIHWHHRVHRVHHHPWLIIIRIKIGRRRIKHWHIIYSSYKLIIWHAHLL
jgi:hypothetical protein